MSAEDRRLAPYDVALPRSFPARYGDGVNRGLCLGGGGLFFIAWQVAYLRKLVSEGFAVGTADKIVGMSAGSFVASALLGGRLRRIHTGMSILARGSTLLPALGSSSNVHPSQQRALDLFWQSGDSDTATLQAIGHASLARTDLLFASCATHHRFGDRDTLAVRGPAHYVRRRLHRRALRRDQRSQHSDLQCRGRQLCGPWPFLASADR